MKSIYITSVECYSGKTATCLALGKRLQTDGHKVGYLKPLSLQPWRINDHITDEDAAFVVKILNLEKDPWDLSPVVVTSDYLIRHLRESSSANMMELVKAAAEDAGSGKDVLLVEGGASLREGYAIGLPTPEVAEKLDCNILAIVKYRRNVSFLDDCLTAQTRLGEKLEGILINRVPHEAINFIKTDALPFLEKKGIQVFGVIPEVPELAALTVEELITILNAQVLTQDLNLDALVETLTVGAMTADAALSRFRKQTHKAVITGGDRTDIQLAALETSTTCLILTGNLHPSPLIVKQAEEFGVPILLVPTNTMETIEAIEGVCGKTRLGQSTKLARFERLVDQHVNFEKLFKQIGLKK